MVSVARISDVETNAGSFKGGSNTGAKAGRPAIPGERYPNGRIKPPNVRNKAQSGQAPISVRRVLGDVIRATGDRHFGRVLGRLLLDRRIHSVPFAAARPLRSCGAGSTGQSPSHGDARSSAKEPGGHRRGGLCGARGAAHAPADVRWPLVSHAGAILHRDSDVVGDEARPLKLAFDMLFAGSAWRVADPGSSGPYQLRRVHRRGVSRPGSREGSLQVVERLHATPLALSRPTTILLGRAQVSIV